MHLRIGQLFLGGLLLLSVSVPAQAVYIYQYTSNVVHVTESISICDIDPAACPPPPIVVPPPVYDVFLTASVYSPVLLTAGTPISTSGLRFSLAISGDLFDVLYFPYPYPVDPSAPGSPANPNNVGVFHIGAVDLTGLPTEWDVSIDFSYTAPTGRFFFRYFSTSTDLDTVAGGYEGFSDFAGSIADQPGVWAVREVPEPSTHALLFAGLGLLAFAVRMAFLTRNTARA